MAIDQGKTADLIAGILAGLGSLALIGRALQQKYFPDLFKTAPTGSANDDAHLKGEEMIRVYDLLRGYVPKDECKSRHDGLCDKFDMLRDEIKQNRELVMDQYRDLSEDMKECRKLMAQIIGGKS